MVEVPQADELTVHQLEQALYDSRRPVSERKLRTLAAAQHALDGRLAPAEQAALLPVYPPASWRGASAQDRYFRSLRLYALNASMRQAPPPVAGQRSAPDTAWRAEPAPRGNWKQSVLTAFELLVALALVVVVVRLYQSSRGVGQAATVAPTLAAPEATAVVAAPTAQDEVLLPGGRQPPSGEVEAEVARSQVALTAPPTPGPQTARRIEIPRIQVDAPIVPGDTYEDLMMGVGQHAGSADPGQPGNLVLSAHNDIYGEIFRELDKLEPGDEVLVYTDQGPYRYVVNSVEIVAPTRVDVLAPTDYGRLTMITCYPYLIDTHRVVVVADLAE